MLNEKVTIKSQTPKPEMVRKLTRPKIERLLKEHRISRLSADEILSELKVPPLQLAPGVVEAASEACASAIAKNASFPPTKKRRG